MDIFTPNENFDFNKITLGNPQPSSGGSFFTKMSLNNKNIYLQLPKCVTKQSIVEALRGKYCDLMYNNGEEPDLFNWIESFESKCQDLIDTKKKLWFESELTREDIETMMTPLTRLFKSNKHVLIRTYLNSSKHTNKDKCIAYDENEKLIELDKIPIDKQIIPLILIDGIRFSARSFEVELKLIQIMIVEPSKEEPIIEEQQVCLIKKKTIPSTNSANFTSLPQSNTNIISNSKENVKLEINEVNELKKNENIKNEEFNQTTSFTNNLINSTIEENNHNDYDNDTNKKSDELNVADEININIDTLPSIDEPKIVDGMEEINFNFDSISDSITLKKPNEVYYEIYKAARDKAKHMKKMAMEAYLEAKEIKTKYMLTDIDDSDEEEFDDSESENDSDIE